jgi:hypothetical protein
MPKMQTIIPLIILIIAFSSLDDLFHESSPGKIANAQQQQQLQRQASPPAVKITSLSQGQQVPVGTLSIEGMSTDTSTSTCNVYVILNNVKPYQRVFPTGNEAQEDGDYSTWNYTFTPQYATIHEGNNKMTSKITCLDESNINSTSNANLTKFNSLNVTGITKGSNVLISNLISNIRNNQSIAAPSDTSSSKNITYAESMPLPDNLSSTSSGITPSQNLQTGDKQIQDNSTYGLSDGKVNTNNVTVAEQRQEGLQKEHQDDLSVGELKDRIFDRVEKQLKDEGTQLDLP